MFLFHSCKSPQRKNKPCTYYMNCVRKRLSV
nr:MAG TPA: hypothetical protein [Caudoviricetes sp.]DAU75927.1 MAG TPA: hypothetical protein [Caudoviricetes sp.]